MEETHQRRSSHRAVPIVCLVASTFLVVQPAAGIITEVFDLIPPGFPYISGVCGLGYRIDFLDVALGVNCGDAGGHGGSITCRDTAGGHNCNATFNGYADSSRWINGATMTGELFGSCQQAKQVSWSDFDGVLPITLPLSCSIVIFVPQGQCVTVRAYERVSFLGNLRPDPYTVGPTEIGLCP